MSGISELVLLSGKGDIVFRGKITSLPLNEDLIIKKSVEFYNDEAPCFIHRSAIMKRLFLELESFIENGAINGRNVWVLSEFPDELKEIVSYMSLVDRIVAKY